MIRKLIARINQRTFKKGLGIIKGYNSIEGWLTPDEAYGLYHYASKLQRNALIIEIGSWKGKSTYCLGKGLRSGAIAAIDPFNASGEPGSAEIYQESLGTTPLIDQFKANLTDLSENIRIAPYQGLSSQFVGSFESIDLLFIDGDHSIEGCSFDFNNFSNILKKGGYLIFHDYDTDRKDLGPTFVIENMVIPSPKYRFERQYDSLWIAKKVQSG